MAQTHKVLIWVGIIAIVLAVIFLAAGFWVKESRAASEKAGKTNTSKSLETGLFVGSALAFVLAAVCFIVAAVSQNRSAKKKAGEEVEKTKKKEN